MAEPIGPGDLVEFIGPRLEADPPIGSVWRCTGVDFDDGFCDTCGKSSTGLFLAGLVCVVDPSWPWCANHFRPISSRSSFEQFLNEVKAPRSDVSVPVREPQTA